MPVSLRVQQNHRMRARVSLMVALSGLGKKPSLNGAAVAAVIIPRVSPTDAEPFRSLGETEKNLLSYIGGNGIISLLSYGPP